MGTEQPQHRTIGVGPSEGAQRRTEWAKLFRAPPSDDCAYLLSFNLAIGRATIRPPGIPDHDYLDLLTTGLAGNWHMTPV